VLSASSFSVVGLHSCLSLGIATCSNTKAGTEIQHGSWEICRVRESTLGNDKAGSDGSGKGSGNATQGGAGVLLP